jgi:hypothetical protein
MALSQLRGAAQTNSSSEVVALFEACFFAVGASNNLLFYAQDLIQVRRRVKEFRLAQR